MILVNVAVTLVFTLGTRCCSAGIGLAALNQPKERLLKPGFRFCLAARPRLGRLMHPRNSGPSQSHEHSCASQLKAACNTRNATLQVPSSSSIRKKVLDLSRRATLAPLRALGAIERAGMSTLNEGQRLTQEVVTERGKQQRGQPAECLTGGIKSSEMLAGPAGERRAAPPYFVLGRRPQSNRKTDMSHKYSNGQNVYYEPQFGNNASRRRVHNRGVSCPSKMTGACRTGCKKHKRRDFRSADTRHPHRVILVPIYSAGFGNEAKLSVENFGCPTIVEGVVLDSIR